MSGKKNIYFPIGSIKISKYSDNHHHHHLATFFKVELDDDGYVVSIGKQPLDPERVYKVATIVDFWRKRDAPSIGSLAGVVSC